MAQGGTLDADPAVIAAVRAILLGPNPIAWIPEVFADPQEPDSPAYVVRLGDEGVLEIERALESFKRKPPTFLKCRLANMEQAWDSMDIRFAETTSHCRHSRGSWIRLP